LNGRRDGPSAKAEGRGQVQGAASRLLAPRSDDIIKLAGRKGVKREDIAKRLGIWRPASVLSRAGVGPRPARLRPGRGVSLALGAQPPLS